MVYKADINKGIVILPSTLKEAGVISDFDYELSVENNYIIVKVLTGEQTKQLHAIDGLYGLLKNDENIVADILDNRVDFMNTTIY